MEYTFEEKLCIQILDILLEEYGLPSQEELEKENLSIENLYEFNFNTAIKFLEFFNKKNNLKNDKVKFKH